MVPCSAALHRFRRGWLPGLAVLGLVVLGACGTANTLDPAPTDRPTKATLTPMLGGTATPTLDLFTARVATAMASIPTGTPDPRLPPSKAAGIQHNDVVSKA